MSGNIFPPKKAVGFKKEPILETKQTAGVCPPEFVPVSVVHDVCDEQELVSEIGLGVLGDMVLEHRLGRTECQILMARKQEIEQILRDALSPVFAEVSSNSSFACEKQVLACMQQTAVEVLVDCGPSEQLMREALESDAFKKAFREQIRPLLRQYFERP